MSSNRLPGKVLMPLGGVPMISHIYDRALKCETLAKVIVATSNDPSDDRLVDYCEQNDMNIYRGSLLNVLDRFTKILKNNPAQYVARITGDCPLIHPPFIDAQIRGLVKYDGDLIVPSNECSVLSGQGVISSRALFKVSQKTNDPFDYEHVGSRYFLQHSDEFGYVKINIPDHYAKHKFRLSVDEESDYRFMDKVFSEFSGESFLDLNQVIEWLSDTGKKYITNYMVEESRDNQSVIKEKEVFTPKLLGALNWIM